MDAGYCRLLAPLVVPHVNQVVRDSHDLFEDRCFDKAFHTRA